MDCILFRHGIAIAREDWKGEDHHRPLTEKGRARTRQAVEGLESLGFKPTLVLTSPFLRAHETAELLHHVLGVKQNLRICDEFIPEGPADKVFPLLANLPQDARVVCVGHEPLLSEMAALMLFGKPVTGLSFRKAGACLIHFGEGPQPGRGRLDWWMMPSQLRSFRKL